MENILLNTEPNQEFDYELDNVRYRVTLLAGDECCYSEVYVNDVMVVPSMMVLPEQPLIPYKYIKKGNLLFINTDNSESYPYYEKFGDTQFLYVMSQSEIDAL